MASGTTAAANTFTPTGSTIAIDNTATHLIVLKLLYTSPTTANVSLYVDPTAGQSTAPAPFETVNGMTVGSISSIGFDGAGGIALTLDEIRVGDTFGDVVNASAVPEPASLSLLAVGAAGLLARRRR